MKKTIYKLSLASVLGLGVLTNAQVLNNSMGVNTDSPKATLDVVTKSGATNSLRVENTSGNETFTFTNAGQLGIGNTTPEYALDILGSSWSKSSINLKRSTEVAVGPGLVFSKTRGTVASPLVVQSNDILGAVIFQGYDGADVQNSASINTFVDGALQEGKRIPSRIEFYTTDYDTSLVNGELRMVIKRDGKVGIGTFNPAERLEVNGSIKSSALAGAGTRNVVADANGKLMVGDAVSSNSNGASLETITGSLRIVSSITPEEWAKPNTFALVQTSGDQIKLPDPAAYVGRIISVNNQYNSQVTYFNTNKPKNVSSLMSGKGQILMSGIDTTNENKPTWFVIGGSY